MSSPGLSPKLRSMVEPPSGHSRPVARSTDLSRPGLSPRPLARLPCLCGDDPSSLLSLSPRNESRPWPLHTHTQPGFVLLLHMKQSWLSFVPEDTPLLPRSPDCFPGMPYSQLKQAASTLNNAEVGERRVCVCVCVCVPVCVAVTGGGLFFSDELFHFLFCGFGKSHNGPTFCICQFC
jgi:hypothetical protein